MDPDRPPNCQPVPQSACAVVYDEKDCTSSWKLIIPMGELRFKWMSQYYAYRLVTYLVLKGVDKKNSLLKIMNISPPVI